MTAWLSLRRTSCTSCGTNPSAVRRYKKERPSLSNSACEGTHSASSRDSTVIKIFDITPRNSSHPDDDLLSGRKVPAIRFRNSGVHFPIAHVRDLRHRLAGARGITHLELGQLLAVIEHVLITVGLDVDVTGSLRFENH